MPLSRFHPVVQDWFRSRYQVLTGPQQEGWPAIADGGHTLIAAPTGSGKTLTAFLAILDRLFREGLEGRLADELRVVYVSPLRALSNDMQKNLELPLAGIMATAAQQGLEAPLLRVGLRTGDTPSHQRATLVRRPPHILVTTPESLYLLLTAEKSREILRSVDTVIVDEIHALVRDKRGSHLALTLERLESVTNAPLQRIGISATQKPIDRMAAFLVGGERETLCEVGEPNSEATCSETSATVLPASRPCTVIDIGHQRNLDLGIEIPTSDLEAVCSHEQWGEINARLVELVQSHRSTLIFVNTRRLAERLSFQLSELLGEGVVGAHHGSLAAEIRLDVERKLKEGQLKAVVATASLELGIDVGFVDLVVQIGSSRSIATFLQRIGRSGHALGLTPKGRLFALTRDELLECMALIRAIRSGTLDAIPIPEAPLDILAQQIVAEVAAQEWDATELFELLRRAYPYRHLTREAYEQTLRYLSEGLVSHAGRARAFLHYDRVNGRLRARKGARLTAISNGGAIGETDTLRVVIEPERTVVGSVDEEFGVESSAGDIFLLGNSAWRIQGLRGTDLVVTDAHGAPPTIPFWQGEAPGRTIELSEEVSRIRADLAARLRAASLADSDSPLQGPNGQTGPDSREQTVQWLMAETHCPEHAAQQAVHYVAAQQAAVNVVPTQSTVVFERFFDETGGMQLVVHAPFGARINRAWGWAMRKRFCRSFDFELQATADDDGFILSLGPQHSFPIEALFPMLRPDNVQGLLEQALLITPTFHLRWRWNASRSLQLERMRNGKKVPPALQRFRSQDLLTAVFPKLTGCQEEHTGDHEIPDHPLVRQTMDDCLHEALDLEALIEILGRVQRGEVTFVARDVREPSPFAYELLNANPYAFLDGGEVQERRARMAETQRGFSIDSIRDLGQLDPAAIETVVDEARPFIRDADELHDALLSRVLLPCEETNSFETWRKLFETLVAEGRATEVEYLPGRSGWVATERFPAVELLFPGVVAHPPVKRLEGEPLPTDASEVRMAILRGLMEVAGPVTVETIAARYGFTESQVTAGLESLEGEGCVMRGRFRPRNSQTYVSHERDKAGADENAPDTSPTTADAEGSSDHSESADSVEWCHRRLLQRIHRLTVTGLRQQIQPVDVPTYLRFLLQYHGLDRTTRREGANGLYEVIGQLQGLDLPAAAWEREVLPARVADYRGEWLDELCLTGEVGWGRLYPPPRDPEKSRPMASITRAAPVSLYLREDLPWLIESVATTDPDTLSSVGQQVLELLRDRGAMFATDLLAAAGILPSQLDDVLGELVTRGLVTSDGFAGLRGLVREGVNADEHRRARGPKLVRHRRATVTTGRWSLWRERLSLPPEEVEGANPDASNGKPTAPPITPQQWAWQLLRRWGVVFRDLLEKEPGAPAWWKVVPVLRRMEMRGEIRGGRFIRGVGGEQYATGEAVQRLRLLRDGAPRAETPSDETGVVILSAADPLNLIGVITSHSRVPSVTGNRIVLSSGIPVAAVQGGEVIFYAECTARDRAAMAAMVPEMPASAGGEESSPDSTTLKEDRHLERLTRRKSAPAEATKSARRYF